MAPFYYVLLAILVVCVILLGILVHAGLFYELQIRMTSPTFLPRRVAYSVHKGPYKNAGTPFGKLAQLVPNLRLFGLYYDDPKSVSPAQLQYIVGCCLPDPANSKLEEKLTANGYSIWTFPTVSNAVVTEFPWRSMLSLFIAPSRVYTALDKYCKEFKLKEVGPWMELCGEDCIRYIGPLDHREGFFVPEVSQEAGGDESKKEQ